ncbi:CGNR zinc finger domain-containing protein [Actinomadura macrotermitis]|uniref:CGNR zinc finger domain-containing protein n=1 Tax=Actinomadura macrotermitis TaxID=2585200 RepID=UPI002E273CE5
MITRPLTGEPLPLDLVNTRWPAQGGWIDALEDWHAEHAAALGGTTGLEQLRAARQAIRRALEEKEYDELNAVLAHGRVRLEMTGDGPVETPEVDDEAWRGAWLAARAFAELVRDAPPGRIRDCEAPDCILWFLDVSRNGRRRWCSMSGCGNRAKARAHYARALGGQAP